jgi:hypothetical protein
VGKKNVGKSRELPINTERKTLIERVMKGFNLSKEKAEMFADAWIKAGAQTEDELADLNGIRLVPNK